MLRRTAAVLVAALGVAVTPAQAARPHDPTLSFLHVGPPSGPSGLPQVVDEYGRTVLLRGINVNGLVDYWTPDLRPPYPTSPAAYAQGRCPGNKPTVTAVPLCAADLVQLRALGFDTLRLPVSWSLLEPEPGRISRAYLDRVAQVVSWAKAQGIWVVVDLHQDAWSKHAYTAAGTTCPPGSSTATGNDGAPLWASQHVTPACNVNGTRELDPAVVEDAQRFWVNAPAADGVGLQDHYARVVAALARRFVDEPAVAGYDLMNEPEPGLLPVLAGTPELMPFYAKVVDAIRATAPRFRQLVFLEPGVERNTTAARYYALPWSAYSSYPHAVYAPHVYTRVFTAGAVTGLPELATFDSDYQAAVDDARSLGLPLWVGEFGGSPSDDATVLAQHYAQQESRGLGGTLWIWKENGTWGVLGPPYPRGVAKPARARLVSRAYPVVVAGALSRAVSNPSTGTADISGIARPVRLGDRRHGTLVRLPSPFDRSRLLVTGARYQVLRQSGGREVWLYPTGGPYRLQASR